MKKRYNDGGLPDYEREPSAEDAAQQKGAVEEYYTKKYGYNKETDGEILDNVFPEPTKKTSFKDAFASARKSGDKTFEWEGKKYTTELASEKPKATAKTKETFSASKSIGASPAKKAPDFMRKAMGMKSGGSVSSASTRADGCAIKGKTRGRMV